MFGLNQITPPAVEPVTLSQAKQFCVVDESFTADDALIAGFITAARVQAENYTRRAFFNQQWRLSLDRFPIFWSRNTVKSTTDNYYPYQYFFEGLTILIPKPHTISIDSVTYVDTTGTTQTLTSDYWFTDYDSEPARMIPARMIPALGTYWPTVSVYVPGSVKITFTCGSYGDGVTANTCPANVQTAICLLASHFYVNREGSVDIPNAFYRLLDSEKFEVFGYGYY